MLFNVVILSIVEGVTEFLPISSTGHLLLLSQYLNMDKSFYEVFDIAIQLGAILAGGTLYFNYFKTVARSPFSRQGLGIVLATLPILGVGFLMRDIIKETLFSPMVIFLGLFIGGIGLIIVEKIFPYQKKVMDSKNNITLKQSIIIGIWQCLALWPGMSRSAMTIMGGVSAGLNRVTSTAFSFVIAVPLITIIVGYDLFYSANQLSKDDFGWVILGIVLSYIVSLLTMRWFLKFVRRKGLFVFGIYRIIVSILGFMFIL